jgi:hypothetical protein
MTAPLSPRRRQFGAARWARVAAIAMALAGLLALPQAAEAGHGRSRSYYSRSRSYSRVYRPAVVVAPYVRYYAPPVYDPYYYAPAPYYDPYYAPYSYGYGYSYSPYRRVYGYRPFYGGVRVYLPHVRIGVGW